VHFVTKVSLDFWNVFQKLRLFIPICIYPTLWKSFGWFSTYLCYIPFENAKKSNIGSPYYTINIKNILPYARASRWTAHDPGRRSQTPWVWSSHQHPKQEIDLNLRASCWAAGGPIKRSQTPSAWSLHQHIYESWTACGPSRRSQTLSAWSCRQHPKKKYWLRREHFAELHVAQTSAHKLRRDLAFLETWGGILHRSAH
jgi:hypothetical protein